MNLDRFGGWKAKKLGPTGFFHTRYNGGRWWLVTPQGHAFLSLGINHYHEGWWLQDYNRAHWLGVFGSQQPRDKEWSEGFRKTAEADLERLGINTLGMHTDAPMLTDKPNGAVVPYLRSFKPIVLDHYRHPAPEAYVDIFAREFEEQCNRTARKEAGPYREDPMLLGYCMSDCPIFTDTDVRSMGGSATWPRILRNLGSDAPGKRIYVETLKGRYPDIAGFNHVYATTFGSWTELAETVDWRPSVAPTHAREEADNEAFLLVCLDRYYSVSKAALRRADPNHLFFGDKLNGNTDNLEKVLPVAARHVDAVLYQFYDFWPGQKALLEKLAPQVDLPFINGDAGFSVPGGMMPNPYGPHAGDQAERASWLTECCEGCFARPEFVGWHMCGVIDTWKTMPGKEHFQHQGLMTVTGEYYPEMEAAVSRIASRLYSFSLNPKPQNS